jgi:HEAT repeat protein
MLFWLSLAFAESTTTISYCQKHLDRCNYALEAQPRPTRNPALFRFSDPELKDPALVPVHVSRLLSEDTEEYVQIALMVLLQFQDLSEVSAELSELTLHNSPEVRAHFVELFPYLSNTVQQSSIEILINDTDWMVREAVVRVIARHLGPQYKAVLTNSLVDETPEVRAQAVKALGWNDISVPLEELRPLLLDKDPTVRLYTVRTIHRLHPTRLMTVPEYTSVQNDPDNKVNREIRRLSTK